MIEFMVNVAKRKMHDDALMMEIMEEAIGYLVERGDDMELLESMQLKLCRLMISKKKTKEAKGVASKLCKMDGRNQRYKAMLLLTAVHDGDFDLAEKTSSEMKIDSADTDDIAVEDLLSEIPNPMESAMGSIQSLRFEMNEKSELERKRAANKRKRERAAAKLRQKYKKHPELYKDPVVWKKTKIKKVEEQKESEKKTQ